MHYKSIWDESLIHLYLSGSDIFEQLSADDDPFDTEDDDDEGEDIIEYQGVCCVYWPY